MLTRKDIKQIARWNGFNCVIEKEYDPDVRGPQKSYDRVYISWRGGKYLYPVDWFYNIELHCRTMKDVIELFEKVKASALIDDSSEE